VIFTVREFALADLEAAAEFCERARERDAQIEPFAQRLGLIATGPRALLPLWRVAQGEDERLYGIAFVAERSVEVYDIYCAVDPQLRRQSMGRALLEAALQVPQTLRARVRDDNLAGLRFAQSLGFVQNAAQLVLQWKRAHTAPEIEMPALTIRRAAAKDEPVLQRLSNDAFEGSFATRADEIAQLFAEEGRLVLLAEDRGRPMGYLSAVSLGRTLGIEEVAVLPQYRRMGIAKALVSRALKNEQAAVLSVDESNTAARALYKSFGFARTQRRLILQRSPEPEPEPQTRT
jgi:ribosomal protein S18 acetylase RimI-like enzyme